MSLSSERLAKTVEKCVLEAPVVDIHTHLYSSSFGDLLLRGIDELLTYHYLIAETLRCIPMKPKDYTPWAKRSRRI